MSHTFLAAHDHRGTGGQAAWGWGDSGSGDKMQAIIRREMNSVWISK